MCHSRQKFQIFHWNGEGCHSTWTKFIHKQKWKQVCDTTDWHPPNASCTTIKKLYFFLKYPSSGAIHRWILELHYPHYSAVALNLAPHFPTCVLPAPREDLTTRNWCKLYHYIQLRFLKSCIHLFVYCMSVHHVWFGKFKCLNLRKT